MAQSPKIVFMGTPDFAVPSLRALAQHFDVVAVYSQPPRRQGRGMKEKTSPVHQAALDLDISVRCPLKFDETAIADLTALSPDFLVVVAYGMILPQAVLDIPHQAPINGHASILPRWRGAAPIHRAIEAGDHETGVTAMIMHKGLDTGPMLNMEKTSIADDETTGQLHDRLSLISASVLVDTINNYDDLTPMDQPEEGITWAEKITPDEAEIDFSQNVSDLDRKLRAFAPFPGSWISLDASNDKKMRLKVKAIAINTQKTGIPGQVLGKGDQGAPLIACADAAIELTQVQPAGKPVMDGRDFLNGYEMPARILKSKGEV